MNLLERELPEDVTPKASEYLRHISASTSRMTELIDRLLTYARAGEGPSSGRPVDVGAAAGAAIADLAGVIAERAAEVRVELDGVPPVMMPRGNLELVLRNLVGNAVKFGAPQGPHVRVGWQPEGDACVRITVEDDGEGIVPDDRERIFRAFERVPTLGRAAGHRARAGDLRAHRAAVGRRHRGGRRRGCGKPVLAHAADVRRRSSRSLSGGAAPQPVRPRTAGRRGEASSLTA